MQVTVLFTVKWQFKEYPYYKVSTCKKIINCKTGRIIKCTKNGGSIGYYISSKFYKKSDINQHIELIPKQQTAVEWLIEELQQADYIPKDSLIMKYVIKQAKEMEEQQQDEFAIGFAEWSVTRAMGFDSFKLNDGELEIYKKEKGL